MANIVYRKKLYFDVGFNQGIVTMYFPCTATLGGTGDRYNGLLRPLEALTGGSDASLKARNAVQAWFAPSGTGAIASGNVTSLSQAVAIDFIGITRAGGPTVTRLPYLAAGSSSPVGPKAGMESIYSITAGQLRHFAVRLRRPNVGAGAGLISLRGTLYVARQHSIEV